MTKSVNEYFIGGNVLEIENLSVKRVLTKEEQPKLEELGIFDGECERKEDGIDFYMELFFPDGFEPRGIDAEDFDCIKEQLYAEIFIL